jgi:flagellar basal body-associated protein FliL
MKQDQNNQNYNPQYNDFTGSNSDLNPNQQPTHSTPSSIHFSPSSVNLDTLSGKSQLDNLMHTGSEVNNPNNYQQPNYNQQPQYQSNDQFSSYNPYQNTGSNINNLQNFAPQENFDTGFNNQGFNTNADFNQTGIEQYKSATPQFNANDSYLMPSTNPEMDDLDESDSGVPEKPQRDTKKILMFGLIGLIVVLLVASLALFFLSQSNKIPSINNATNPNSSKPTTQGLPANDKSSASTVATEQNTTSDTNNKTGNANTPASQSIVNQGATTLSAEWLKTNFTKLKGALAEDGSCKLQNVCGLKSDVDKDGLDNLDEYIYGTNPTLPDSDNDGLSDKDELFVYYSDPKSEDTNTNTYNDGTEVSNCYDPNIPSQKLSKVRLNEISSNVNKAYVKGLSPVTQATLKTAGAKVSELEKGYMTKCAIGSVQETVIPKSTSPEKIKSRQPSISDKGIDANSNEGA